MSGHRKFWGLRCKMCGRPVKELCACDLTFEDKTVQINLCFKCMKWFGLKEDIKENIHEVWPGYAGDPPK